MKKEKTTCSRRQFPNHDFYFYYIYLIFSTVYLCCVVPSFWYMIVALHIAVFASFNYSLLLFCNRKPGEHPSIVTAIAHPPPMHESTKRGRIVIFHILNKQGDHSPNSPQRDAILFI